MGEGRRALVGIDRDGMIVEATIVSVNGVLSQAARWVRDGLVVGLVSEKFVREHWDTPVALDELAEVFERRR